MIWLYFIFAQLCCAVATVVGWVLLLPFCLANAWTYDVNRDLDRWSWAPLNYIYGNPEDGVSGQQAEIWGSGEAAGHKIMYASTFYPGTRKWWIAYCWSAWRNSSDGLKYVFAREDGPLWTPTIFGRKHSIGWKREKVGVKVLVLS